MNKVSQEDLTKALQSLQDIAKGKGQTVTTKPASMKGESGDTHVVHHSGDSDPGSWAGSKAKDVPENGATDGIDKNGTDYKGGAAKMMKSILHKLAKGLPLTAAEAQAYSAIAKGEFGVDEDDEEVTKAKGGKKAKKGAVDEAMDQEDHPDAEQDAELINEMMGKSLQDHARANDKVSEGFEVSDFLAQFADVMHKSLVSTESRIRHEYAQRASEQAEFNKSLAEAVHNLASVLGVQAQRIEQVESAPARGPKSQTAAVRKSLPDGETLNKSQVLGVMVDLVRKGQLDRHDVLKYESTGEIRPDVKEKVLGALGR